MGAMGILGGLIGGMADQLQKKRMQKHNDEVNAQKFRVDRAMGALRDPNATPDARRAAAADLQDAIGELEGGGGGKKGGKGSPLSDLAGFFAKALHVHAANQTPAAAAAAQPGAQAGGNAADPFPATGTSVGMPRFALPALPSLQPSNPTVTQPVQRTGQADNPRPPAALANPAAASSGSLPPVPALNFPVPPSTTPAGEPNSVRMFERYTPEQQAAMQANLTARYQVPIQEQLDKFKTDQQIRVEQARLSAEGVKSWRTVDSSAVGLPPGRKIQVGVNAQGQVQAVLPAYTAPARPTGSAADTQELANEIKAAHPGMSDDVALGMARRQKLSERRAKTTNLILRSNLTDKRLQTAKMKGELTSGNLTPASAKVLWSWSWKQAVAASKSPESPFFLEDPNDVQDTILQQQYGVDRARLSRMVGGSPRPTGAPASSKRPAAAAPKSAPPKSAPPATGFSGPAPVPRTATNPLGLPGYH